MPREFCDTNSCLEVSVSYYFSRLNWPTAWESSAASAKGEEDIVKGVAGAIAIGRSVAIA